MNRAYSVLEIKEIDKDKRTFKGIATTISTDRHGDIVHPSGAKFSLPMPLLWQHDMHDPIGWVTSATTKKDHIEIEGEVASIQDEGELKSRLDKAWQMLKSGLVRGLSIGFNPIKHAFMDDSYGIEFLEWDWLELSAVTIPANQEANIISIKAADRKTLSALGIKKGSSVKLVPKTPGVSGDKAGRKNTAKSRTVTLN